MGEGKRKGRKEEHLKRIVGEKNLGKRVRVHRGCVRALLFTCSGVACQKTNACQRRKQQQAAKTEFQRDFNEFRLA